VSLPSAERLRATGSERLVWLDVAKGIAIIGVVLFHAGSVAPGGTHASTVWTQIDLVIFTFILPLFFLVSGLVFGRAMSLPWKRFLLKRPLPLLYLFVLWSLIFALFAALSGGTVGWPLLQNLELQTVLWFLPALAVHMVLVRALRGLNPVVHIAVAAVIALPFAVWFPFAGYGLTHTPHFYVFFVLGVLCRGFVLRIATRARLRDFALLAVIAMVLLALALSVPALKAIAYALSPLAAVPAVLIASEWLSRVSVSRRVLGYIGQRTMPVFLVHALVLQLGIWGVSAAHSTSEVVLLAAPLTVSIVAVAAGLLIEVVFRRTRGVTSEPWRSSPTRDPSVFADSSRPFEQGGR
jgi:uncharacterized membrane protein YcfT